MRFGEIVDSTTAASVQVSWLHAALDPVSEAGKRAAQTIAPYKPGEERAAQANAQRIVELAQTIAGEHVDAMRDALRTAPDPVEAIARAGMGGVLTDANLLELMRFLDAMTRIDTLLDAANATMRFVNEESRAVARVLEHGRAGKFGFYLADGFDAALTAARSTAESAQAEFEGLRGRFAQRIARELGREEIAGSEFIVMRDSAMRLPPGVRVVREAPTYFLCELDFDDTALEAMRKRDASAEAVAAAEEAVRTRLSGVVRDRSKALEDLLCAAGEFDVLLARIRFTQEHACVVPEIPSEQSLSFELAHFLPLESELQADGRPYEPISIDLDDIAVLTGPNMGGKSVALRTCGLIALLTAFGIPVPASAARCSLFVRIAWLGIGAAEEADGLLSSFAREVVRLKELLAEGGSRTLMLVDEFARTTTPAEGKALLVALVRGLKRRGRLAFVATHLERIAEASGARHFAVRGLRSVPTAVPNADLHEVLTSLCQAMDYAIVPVDGATGAQGDAIALAHLLGLDDDVVAEAGMVLGTEGVSAWNP